MNMMDICSLRMAWNAQTSGNRVKKHGGLSGDDRKVTGKSPGKQRLLSHAILKGQKKYPNVQIPVTTISVFQ